MSSNNHGPEAKKRRLEELPEQERLEEWREKRRKENERVLQLIQQQFEEEQGKGALADKKG